ncbi:MAG: hypothetical protein INF43_01385, partial [Alphaproteobacteria bacterium]|nr:hypothetical protein [Alphaproteobacteria bacterium]
NLSATLIQTARISSTNVSGSVGDFTTLRVNGVAVSVGGGSVSPTTPGGASGQVQFNNAGAFDASANLTWTNASSLLTITGTLSATNVYGLNISGTTGFFPNATITALSAGAIAANSLSSTLVSASNVSATRISGSIADFTTLRVNGVNITGSGGTPAGVSGSIQFNSNGTFAGRNNLVVDSNGQVGIGTGTPNASLTVIGRVSATTVQVARDSTACGSGDLGALRLDPSTGRLQVCRQ